MISWTEKTRFALAQVGIELQKKARLHALKGGGEEGERREGRGGGNNFCVLFLY
jgi:hypothetical protein